MDPLAPAKAFDRLQRRHRKLAIPMAVIKKFGEDQGGNLAAVIAYYGFFSLFPLLLVFVAVLGFVLEGNPSAQEAVLNSALNQFPLIGDQLKAGALTGSTPAVVIGAVGAVISGLAVTLATQTAFNRAQGVAFRERPSFIPSRLRGLGMLFVLGTLQLLSTVVTGIVSGGLGGPLLVIAGLVVSLLLNLLLFAAAFRLLTDDEISTRELRPGVAMATVLWTILQAVGGAYIGHVVRGADSTYGTFATVIGLLTWLFLGARIIVYSAELNSVLARGLWPRSLFEPLEPADHAALRALAKIETRVEDQTVSVTFGDEARPTPTRRPQ
jgi:membrane protein